MDDTQADRRNSAADKNAQRDDIDEAMGEGGGDEEEDGESEDDNEDACGGSSISKRDTHTLPTHSLTHPYIFTFLCVSHTNTLEVLLNLPPFLKSSDVSIDVHNC